MKNFLSPGLITALAGAAAMLASASASAQITVYEHDGYQGRNFTSTGAIEDLRRSGFNDRASSVVVAGQQWEICENAVFGGSCRVLRPGQYASLTAMGMNDRVSSVRPVARNVRMEPERYGPEPLVATDYRQRRNERLFDARVTGARAYFGVPAQRCWIESDNVDNRDDRLPGAASSAVMGGILGHQMGNSADRTRELAELGGVEGGAIVAGNFRGRRGAGAGQRQVRRCTQMPGPGAPAFWDVSYTHRGQTHHVQLAQPPGTTVTVNRAGEPRI